LTIALPARAKLNLDLAVLGRRDDGFHDVRTTLQAIDLHDLITLTPAPRTTLTISGLAAPNTKDNSVLKAHAALEEAVKKKLPTAIHIDKRIPPGSGMGGASSDAATTLKGLSALHHVTFDLTSIGQIKAVRFVTGDLEVRVERKRGQARCPCCIEIPETSRLKPIPHPPDRRVDMLFLRVDEDLHPVLLLQSRVSKAVVVGVDHPIRPVRYLRLVGTCRVVGPSA